MAGVSCGCLGQGLGQGELSGRLGKPRNGGRNPPLYDGDGMGAMQRDIRPRVREFPSLRYYYQTEEPGMGFYETNDSEGKYFTDKYIVDLCTAKGKYFCEYFADRESLFAWLGEVAGKTVRSEQDAKALFEEWAQENPDSCCSINEYVVVD